MSTYTKFTGKNLAATFNTVAGAGLTEIEVAEDGAGLPKLKDVTTAPATEYVEVEDPLGSSEPAKTMVRITMLASSVDVADSKWLGLLGSTHPLVVLPDHTAGSSDFTLTNAYLQEIDTHIKVDEYATRSFVFAANEAGAWGTHV